MPRTYTLGLFPDDQVPLSPTLSQGLAFLPLKVSLKWLKAADRFLCLLLEPLCFTLILGSFSNFDSGACMLLVLCLPRLILQMWNWDLRSVTKSWPNHIFQQLGFIKLLEVSLYLCYSQLTTILSLLLTETNTPNAPSGPWLFSSFLHHQFSHLHFRPHEPHPTNTPCSRALHESY